MGLKAAWKALFSRPEIVTIASQVDDESLHDPTITQLVTMTNGHHAEITQLRLEWAETLDKFTAWANRQAARDRVRMKKSMGEMAAQDADLFEESTSGAQPMPVATGMEGIPASPENHRHPKADLYARINRR